MNRSELRSELIAALLQAGGPLALGELAKTVKAAKRQLSSVLEELVDEGLVLEGKLLRDAPTPHYCWWACWERLIEERTAQVKESLRTATDAQTNAPEIDSLPVVSFHNYIVNEYRPPEDKRILVFLQCSVRRPFSTSPSHASMRRAIAVATGCDPANEFLRCPVHVVVMASKVGPAPYELEDVYPVNVRGGGVKHFSDEYYAHVKPILAERLAEYIKSHRDSYDHIASFTQGRYGEVMEATREIAGVDFPIFPTDGPRILQMGRKTPRPYWEKYWIQLYLAIVDWLSPVRRAEAEERLKQMEVEYE
ncbi:DUF5591 domain-containing protein [PVC group bacterium]|nr:DUF5591 domain-containing protein [PVC group bacterium]